jgi:hypothetical protein
MNYTEVYRKLYNSVKNENLSHEEVHKFALSIAEAISHLYGLTKFHDDQVIDTVSKIANELWNPLNLGGFDLDDKGQPIGFGINATGLNNNK